MELLLKRNEIGRNKFDLFAKLELNPEEEARLRKGEIRNTYVWQPENVDQLKEGTKSGLTGVAMAIIVGFVAAVAIHPALFVIVTPIAWLPLRKLVFQQTRSGITIADIISGRTIRCRSLDELYVKENAIKDNIQKYVKAHEQMHALGNEQRIQFNT
jgi:hypothetical protein